MPKQIQVGSAVAARLRDGRKVEATVTKIVDSVVSGKVHIAFEAFALIIDAVEIIGEARP